MALGFLRRFCERHDVTGFALVHEPVAVALHDDGSTFHAGQSSVGFRYAPDFIGAAEEARLVGAFADLPFKEFEFHGFLGRRRVVSFGTRYDFNGGGLKSAEPMPSFLLPLRERAAAFAGLPPDRLQHALITEYSSGTSIGRLITPNVTASLPSI